MWYVPFFCHIVNDNNVDIGGQTSEVSSKRNLVFYVILGRCRLFFGNVPSNFTEKRFLDLIQPYGDSEDMYISDKKTFGFVKMVNKLKSSPICNLSAKVLLQSQQPNFS